MRLNKFIAQSGYCSRRKADEFIFEGHVFINGERQINPATQVGLKDTVMVQGNEVQPEEQLEYYIFRKPKGVVTSVTDDRGRRTVLDYIDTSLRLYPVGRLDFESTGVLLLTNDGDFCHKISHPSSKIDKVYEIIVSRKLSKEEITSLSVGINIEGRLTHPCEIKVLDSPGVDRMALSISLHEGRNRQIRKMIESLGNAYVRKLDRISYGGLKYKGLKPGNYRSLTLKELHALKSIEANLHNDNSD